MLIDGRKYTVNGVTKQLKELQLMMLGQEQERVFAMLSAVSKGKQYTVPVTEGGAFTFSTKHTTVDENGEPEAKSELLTFDSGVFTDFDTQTPALEASS